MTNFEFADCLSIDPFSDNNEYNYGVTWLGNTKFCKDSENLPYIFKGQIVQSSPFNMTYCQSTNQLKGRLLTVKKIKEVMNTSRYPLLFRIKDVWYYIGKGYISRVTNLNSEPTILFVATIKGGTNPRDLSEVKFFVNRAVFTVEAFKPVVPVVKDFMNNHTGDVILTNNINKYIGESIQVPQNLSLSQLENYTKGVVSECIADIFTNNKIPTE